VLVPLPEDLSGRLTCDGVPLTIADLADEAALTVDEVTAGLKTLADAEMVFEAGGCWVLTNFQKWQESPGAARMRRHRDRQAADLESDDLDSDDLEPSDTEPHPHLPSDSSIEDRETTEDRGQKTEDRDCVTPDRHSDAASDVTVTPNNDTPDDNSADADVWPDPEDVQRFKPTIAWPAYISDTKALPGGERPGFEAWHQERYDDRPLPKTLRAAAR